MKLYRSVSAAFAGVVGLIVVGGCTKAGSDSQDAAAVAGDTADTTDQTAPQAPPAPQTESPGPAPSPTDLWASGSWHFEQGRFVWAKGHWEPRREGQYQQARWVEVNGRWEHHPGHWIVERAVTARPAEPRAPEPRPAEPRPPEPRPETRPVERR